MENPKAVPIRIRPADDADAPFVFSTWLKSFSGQNKNLNRQIVYEFEDDVVKDLLSTSITLLAVGNSVASAGDIYGFICGERTADHLVIHYCYVKAPFRQFGVGRALLDAFDYRPGELIIHTYQGYIAKELRKKGFSLLYVPYLRDPEMKPRWEKFYEGSKDNLEGR